LKLSDDTDDIDEDGEDIEEIVRKLRTATISCPPFVVTLDRFGTFGGTHRGVLWLSPESSSSSSSTITKAPDDENETIVEEAPPLITLQKKLEGAFPTCNDQSSKGSSKNFTPHMTMSHFETLSDAETARERLAASNNDDDATPSSTTFLLDRIYLLRRVGDDGQFERVAEIFLGEGESDGDSDGGEEGVEVISDGYRMFRPPSPFPGMPTTEEDWVHEERMAMKARRNGRWRRGGGDRSKRGRLVNGGGGGGWSG